MRMSAAGQAAQIGQHAPDFELGDTRNVPWRLSAQRGKVVLLLFYPANETLVCTRQLCSLRDNWAAYLETRAEIAAVSSGSSDDNREFATKHDLPLNILADEDRSVTRSYIRHRLLPLNFLRGIVVIDAVGRVRALQSMLRAFRPNDHDIIMTLWSARTDSIELKREELRQRVRKVIL